MDPHKKDTIEIALRRGVRANVFGLMNLDAIAELVAKDDLQTMMKGHPELNINVESEEFKKALSVNKRLYMRHGTIQGMADMIEERLSLDAEKGMAFLANGTEAIDAYPGLADCLAHAKLAFLHSAHFDIDDLPLPFAGTTDEEHLDALRILEQLNQKKLPDEIEIGDLTMSVSDDHGQIKLGIDQELDHHTKQVLDDVNQTINQALVVKKAQKAYERKLSHEASTPGMSA